MCFKLPLTIFACFVLSFIHAGEINNFINCGSDLGKIMRLDIDDCDQTPCSFFKGRNVTLRLNFKSFVDSQSLTIKIDAKKFFLTFPVPLLETDTCKLGVNCPIKTGDSNNITIVFPILESYPEVI